ncbi:MAG TPA: iron chelate uptake ABC transporter family permease subunit, partial [Arenicellales bacterium]|nr:iron chelate uptake ABC transporter family permease subunit [Arenicellales bacterium]
MSQADGPPSGAARLGGAILLLAVLLLMAANIPALGGPEWLRAGWQAAAGAPIEAVQLVHGWLPRVAVSLLAGAGLGAAGAALQQVLRNPIAAPMTLGVAAGAKLALSLLTLSAPALLPLLAEPAAMLGGALALLVVLGLAARRALEPVTVVLAGLVVTLYLGALNAGLLLFFELDLTALLIWGSGALTQHGWGDAMALTPRVLLGIAALALLIRPLAVMGLDEASARGLGIGLTRTRLLILALAVYLTAAVVATVGVVGFVGLAAPAVARLLGARTFSQRLAAAPLLGGLLLLLTDQFVQWLGAYTTGLLPTGAVTALLGAPLLLWLLRRVRTGTPAVGHAGTVATGDGGERRLPWIAGATLLIVLAALCVGRDAAGWRADGFDAMLADFPWRAPRVAVSLLAGVLLATAGVILQRLLRN